VMCPSNCRQLSMKYNLFHDTNIISLTIIDAVVALIYGGL
jgi:hypothetical protein